MINDILITVFSALGSNMPCTPEAVDVMRKSNVLIAPAMAAGAGGVKLIYLDMLMIFIFFIRIAYFSYLILTKFTLH